MLKRTLWSAAALLVAMILLSACSGEKFELAVAARMDDKPAAQAKVTVDGKDLGVTDGSGNFSIITARKAGSEVELVVSKDLPGHRIKPWKTTFLVKLSKGGGMEKYAFTADLNATRYFTIKATEKGSPVPDAVIRSAKAELGKTNDQGAFVYEYKDLPASGIELAVTKTGYAAWRKSVSPEPGQTVEAALSRRVTVTISALMEEYGQTSGIPGIGVNINNRAVGKTNDSGMLAWSYDGEPGKKVPVVLTAPGFIPDTWKTTTTLEGEVRVSRFFYPTVPRQIRTGIYRFTGNTPNADLKDIVAQTENAVSAQLFKNSCFREVPSKQLQDEVKKSKLSIDKITTKGWRETPLRKSVDMIILGSVAQDEKGYLIETKFYASGGKLILSRITRAKSAGDINSAAREIANTVVERFPFEGTVIGADGDRFRINLGKAGYRIVKGTDFTLLSPRADETGKVSGYRETGRLRVKKSEEAGSWTEVEALTKGERIQLGDRVVRRIYREGEEEAGRTFFVVSAKGGIAPDVAPLAGVNVYVNEEWLGSTGTDGRVEIPVRLNKNFNMVLYRHGYQQVSQKLSVEKNKDVKEFVLAVNNSLFRVESDPPGAEVTVDGEKIGATPILAGKQVPLGFHTVRVSLGGDYRDWEEVIEFSKKEEYRTGDAKIVLFKDYLKIGERAEQKGDIDAAIAAYSSTAKGHPDYSMAHHRLAQIYLDDKGDYEKAITEFERVLSLPENQQLVYKQFSVAFMNLGHAYYERGSALVQKDRDAAAQSFSKAIQNLQIAKQNLRFYPNDRYDEAVHDTYYYTALASHKLYLLTRKNNALSSANLAWSEYFDFFPKKLEGSATFDQARDTAQKYWDQIRNL
ncbi:MAG TPA: PEGA domain-containing protein [Nitrospirota bacterium]|nr:PEGA domain-containing protein [Nitrospirota bacterium]